MFSFEGGLNPMGLYGDCKSITDGISSAKSSAAVWFAVDVLLFEQLVKIKKVKTRQVKCFIVCCIAITGNKEG